MIPEFHIFFITARHSPYPQSEEPSSLPFSVFQNSLCLSRSEESVNISGLV